VDDPVAPLQRGQFWSFLRTLLPSTIGQQIQQQLYNRRRKELVTTVQNIAS
jgi:hypothetical protein